MPSPSRALRRAPLNATTSWVLDQARELILLPNTTESDASNQSPQVGECEPADYNPDLHTLSPAVIELLEEAAARLAEYDGKYEEDEVECADDDDDDDARTNTVSSSLLSFTIMLVATPAPPPCSPVLDTASVSAMSVPIFLCADDDDDENDDEDRFLAVPRPHRLEDGGRARLPGSSVALVPRTRVTSVPEEGFDAVPPSPVAPGLRIEPAPRGGELDSDVVRPVPQRAGHLVVPEGDFRVSPFVRGDGVVVPGLLVQEVDGEMSVRR